MDKDLSDDQVIDHISKNLDYYTEKGIEKRMGGFIDKIGFEKFFHDIFG